MKLATRRTCEGVDATPGYPAAIGGGTYKPPSAERGVMTETGRVAGRTAVVTGGGAGIGAATCLRLAEEGADVAVVDRDADAARETAQRVEAETDGTTAAVETDVSDEAAVAAMAETVADRFGGAEILVNNAAVRVDPRPVTEADETSWDRAIAVNQKGAAFCAKHVVPLIAGDGDEAGDKDGDGDEDGGAVVNVTSVGASMGRADWAQYDSTKGALTAMTKDMACDHAPDGVRVNAVAPGWVITDYHLPDDAAEADRFFDEKTTPHPGGPGVLKRAAEPREIANAILFLASEEASFVTATTLAVDGGHAAVGQGLEWESL